MAFDTLRHFVILLKSPSYRSFMPLKDKIICISLKLNAIENDILRLPVNPIEDLLFDE